MGQAKFGRQSLIATPKLAIFDLGTPGETSASMRSSKKSTRIAAYTSIVSELPCSGIQGKPGHLAWCQAWKDNTLRACVSQSPLGFYS